jgi:hypothetical protein
MYCAVKPARRASSPPLNPRAAIASTRRSCQSLTVETYPLPSAESVVVSIDN